MMKSKLIARWSWLCPYIGSSLEAIRRTAIRARARGPRFPREALPDRDPVFVYTNFEFIGDDGSVNEIDSLVVTQAGVFLLELKVAEGSSLMRHQALATFPLKILKAASA